MTEKTVQIIWYSGVRMQDFMFIDFAHGSGWIEVADFQDCPPDYEYNPYKTDNRLDG